MPNEFMASRFSSKFSDELASERRIAATVVAPEPATQHRNEVFPRRIFLFEKGTAQHVKVKKQS